MKFDTDFAFEAAKKPCFPIREKKEIDEARNGLIVEIGNVLNFLHNSV